MVMLCRLLKDENEAAAEDGDWPDRLDTVCVCFASGGSGGNHQQRRKDRPRTNALLYVHRLHTRSCLPHRSLG